MCCRGKLLAFVCLFVPVVACAGAPPRYNLVKIPTYPGYQHYGAMTIQDDGRSPSIAAAPVAGR